MAWAEVAVAATEQGRRCGSAACTIVAAALALPGVATHAENAPERGEIALKYLHYEDRQPGLDRITVKAPSLYLMAPISPKWAIEGSVVADSVSGATPRYHDAISGATQRMSDLRRAADLRLTHYADRSSYSAGFSRSKENDYTSSAASFAIGLSSDDNNRTWNIGYGYAYDRIGSSHDALFDERRRTTELMLGVTQALSATDLVQGTLTFNAGRGHYSDPYKEPDVRPRTRDQRIVLLRWNHHFTDVDASMRTSYRFYRDTFGIKAHTLGIEWVQPAGGWLTLTPSLRLYSQSASTFYFDPVYDPALGAPYPPGYFTNPPEFISSDQRLSAFGAVTAGLKFAVRFSADWSGDLKVERYEQRSKWHVGGEGSPGLSAFSATFVQIGLAKRF